MQAKPSMDMIEVSHSKIVAAVDYMRNNRQPMCIVDIANYVNLSPSRFKHLFKEVTGLTPKRMLRRLQVERASQMLRDGDEQIKWIAAEAGMPTLATFHRNFRAICLATPREYRQAAADARTPVLPDVEAVGMDFGAAGGSHESRAVFSGTGSYAGCVRRATPQ